MAQVMQQPFGPFFKGSNAGSNAGPDAAIGGDHGDKFADLMAAGDDSLARAEGFENGAVDTPSPIVLTVEPAPPSHTALVAQMNVPLHSEFGAVAPNAETYHSLNVENAAGDKSTANFNAEYVVPNTALMLATSVDQTTFSNSVMSESDSARAVALTGGGMIIEPTLAANALAANTPILDEMAQNLATTGLPDRMQANQTAFDLRQTARVSSGMPSPDAAISPAANSGGGLDISQGVGASSRTGFAPAILMNTASASVQILTAQALVIQSASVDEGKEVLAANASVDRMGDKSSGVSMLLRGPTAPASSAAFVAIQAMMQNAEAQTAINDAALAKGVQAEAGDMPNAAISAAAAAPTTSAATHAGQIHAQIQAQITAANFAALVDGARDDLGFTANENAGLDGVGVEARAGLASPHLPGALGTASSGFSGTPATAAQLSAQLLPLAKSAQAGPVELVLSPAELGQLRFEIQHRGDQVQIVLSAERPETLDLLRRNSDQLLADFRDAGFAGASLAFGDWGAGQNPEADPQDFDGGASGDRRAEASDAQSSPNQNAAFARPQTYLDPSRSLNLRL